VATVHVWAYPEKKDTTITVTLQGSADAIVSRGLLALLSEYLSTLHINQVLQLDPQRIADQLHVRAALSRGRNDGLANMLQIIQQQLLPTVKEEDEEAEDNYRDTTTTTTASTIPNNNDHNKRPTVALLLSGGVDSSVALRLLQQEGYHVTAFYLKIWLEDELAHLGTCPWEEDVQMCHQVCDQAGVELKIISLQDQYHERVMQHTLQEARLGRTPNPDILCNSRVKFGCFLDYLDDDDGSNNDYYDYIASGHYAQLVRHHNNKDDGGDDDCVVRLMRAPDPIKDQSYFLCALQQSQLKRLLFPIGHLEKTQVRQLAEGFQLPNRHRPDSQGLCFLGKVKFKDFLNQYLGTQPGDIVDAFSYDIIGRHEGVWYHTVGQRKGIGNSLYPKATARGPWYVVAKDPSQNIVYASNHYEEKVFAQARSEFHVESIHWIAGYAPLLPNNTEDDDDGARFRCSMKIRHGPRLVSGSLQLLPEEDGGIIQLDEKDGGLAPGQYVVFYTEDAECLGGGIISERHWAKFLLDAKSREQGLEANDVTATF
jgi:tRNA-specific 2-thiouridylase